MLGCGHRQRTKVCRSYRTSCREMFLQHLLSICSLNTDATNTLVSAFITGRVDYCNSVFNGTGSVHLRPVQSILKASLHFTVKKQKYDQIMATIRDEQCTGYWCENDSNTNYASSSTRRSSECTVVRIIRHESHSTLIMIMISLHSTLVVYIYIYIYIYIYYIYIYIFYIYIYIYIYIDI